MANMHLITQADEHTPTTHIASFYEPFTYIAILIQYLLQTFPGFPVASIAPIMIAIIHVDAWLKHATHITPTEMRRRDDIAQTLFKQWNRNVIAFMSTLRAHQQAIAVQRAFVVLSCEDSILSEYEGQLLAPLHDTLSTLVNPGNLFEIILNDPSLHLATMAPALLSLIICQIYLLANVHQDERMEPFELTMDTSKMRRWGLGSISNHWSKWRPLTATHLAPSAVQEADAYCAGHPYAASPAVGPLHIPSEMTLSMAMFQHLRGDAFQRAVQRAKEGKLALTPLAQTVLRQEQVLKASLPKAPPLLRQESSTRRYRRKPNEERPPAALPQVGAPHAPMQPDTQLALQTFMYPESDMAALPGSGSADIAFIIQQLGQRLIPSYAPKSDPPPFAPTQPPFAPSQPSFGQDQPSFGQDHPSFGQTHHSVKHISSIDNMDDVYGQHSYGEEPSEFTL
jgi:hypothetical protein